MRTSRTFHKSNSAPPVALRIPHTSTGRTPTSHFCWASWILFNIVRALKLLNLSLNHHARLLLADNISGNPMDCNASEHNDSQCEANRCTGQIALLSGASRPQKHLDGFNKHPRQNQTVQRNEHKHEIRSVKCKKHPKNNHQWHIK